MTSFRPQRVAEQLHSFIAEQLRTLHNPSLHLVTVTDVKISPDLKNARIYWAIPMVATPPTLEQGSATVPESAEQATTLGPTKAQLDEISRCLQSVISLLKKRIGAELSLRYVPQLHFHYDDSSQRGSRIDYLLRKAGALNG